MVIIPMRKGAHTQYDIQYHIVWTTKYRYKILQEKIAMRIRELIRQGCEARKVTIIKGNVGRSHIHILVSCPSSISVSKLVQYLKGRSSKIIQEEFVFSILKVDQKMTNRHRKMVHYLNALK